jgi:malate dehydrogenase
MSRDDLLNTNARIVREVSQNIARVAPDSIIIMVSNPLDVMSGSQWRPAASRASA